MRGNFALPISPAATTARQHPVAPCGRTNFVGIRTRSPTRRTTTFRRQNYFNNITNVIGTRHVVYTAAARSVVSRGTDFSRSRRRRREESQGRTFRENLTSRWREKRSNRGKICRLVLGRYI